MKVILIKIYGGEEEEMVHVSMVSGTPLGLRDMTVISQISDRWRDRPVGPHCSHNFHTRARCHLNKQTAVFTESRQDYACFSMQFTPPSHLRV